MPLQSGAMNKWIRMDDTTRPKIVVDKAFQSPTMWKVSKQVALRSKCITNFFCKLLGHKYSLGWKKVYGDTL
jgi:hypothetical protein